MPDVPTDLAEHVGQPTYGNVTILNPDSLSDLHRNSLPPWWIEAAHLSGSAATERVFAEWDKVVPGLFPGFTNRLRNDATRIYIGRNPQGLLLIYAVRVDDKDVPYECWYGYLPAPPTSHPKIDAQLLPAGLVAFHTGLHDKFAHALAVHNGMVPASEWTIVGEHFDDDDIEYFDTEQTADLNRLVAFYAGAGKQYLCAELTDDPAHRFGWIWVEASLSPVDDIWTQIDSWLLERLSGERQ
jgi:hypothetical protein